MAPEHQAAVLDLDEDAWTRLTDAVYAFEEAWRAGTASAIGRFLPPPDDPLRPQILAELIKVDQERRWAAGESRLLEAYLAEWPELRENAEAIAGLLEAECATRTSFDATPTLADLASRFPTLCERIDLARVAAEVDADRSVPPGEDGRIPERLVDVSCGIAAIHRGSDHSPVLVAGARLGRYEIRQPLGRGGMATVYQATDSQLGREVALKIPRFEPDTEHAVIERFLREGKAAAAVDHPHVCPVYDAGEIDGTAYIAMRFIAGQSLARVLADGPLPIRDVVTVIRKLADALVAVHAAGVIHRDIKASNVLLTGNGEPLLTDFGLSRQTADTQHLTTTGSPIGTPATMSPEQVRGDHGAIDARTDIYSLGVLLYQLLTGRLPFEGPLTEVLIGIKQVEPPRPGTLRPEIDRELDAICRKAMAKRPANRYQTAQAFADTLDAYLRTTPEERRHREHRRRILTACTAIAAAVLIFAAAVPCVRAAKEFFARHRGRLANAVPSATPTVAATSPIPIPPTQHDWEHAIPLTLEANRGMHNAGMVEQVGDRVFFRIRTVCDGRLKVHAGVVPGGSLDPYVRLYGEGPDRPLVAANDNAVGIEAEILLGVRADEEYLIEVSGANGSTGTFNLLVNNSIPEVVAAAERQPAASPDDYPNTRADAHVIVFDDAGEIVLEGIVRPPGDEDWFTFIAPREGGLTVTVETPYSSLDTRLELSTGQGIVAADDNRFATTVQHGDTLWLRIRANTPVKERLQPIGRYIVRMRLGP